jgi:hypothetical protein
MNDLVSRPPTPPAPGGPPTFETLEPTLVYLRESRERAITEGASPDLLERLDQALSLVERDGIQISAAAAPASSGEAGVYLLLLTRAFPNSGTQDGKAFGRLMLEDVLSLRPCVASVDIACRRWRRTNKWLPAISEIMAEVKADHASIVAAAEFAEGLQALREKIARELGAG